MRRYPLAVVLPFVLCFVVPAAVRAQATYHDHAALGRRIAEIAGQHPQRVAVRSLGSTRGGREIWCATIGGAGHDARPAVLIVGGIDGAGIAGSELALRIIERLAADRSDSVRELLARTTFYVIPRASPDANEAYFELPRRERSTNLTPHDGDRDGSVDEDGPDDIDGDGVITQMRVRSASGRWIADPTDPRFLREADASRGERGVFEVHVEGRDDDGDREQGEDPVGGVDINRNFPFNYRPFDAASGANPVSEIETRALADFCYDHQNIAAVFSFSSQSNLLHPWDPRKEGAPGGRVIKSVREEDTGMLNRIAKLYSDVTGRKGGPAYARGEGSFVEWAYYHYGRLSIGAPAWWIALPKPEGSTPTGDSARADSGSIREAAPAMRDTLEWLERNGVTGAFKAWRSVQHPDYPGREVEIGGFAPFATREPPAAMLDSLGELHARFVMGLGTLLPRLELVDLRTEALGDGLTRVRATVVNTGYLPTLLAMGKTSQVPLDVKAELVLAKGQTVATGRRVQLLGPIAGNGGSKELTWVITGRGAVGLRIGGPMTGGIERSIELGG